MFKINYDEEFDVDWTPFRDLCRMFIEDTMTELCCAEISGKFEKRTNNLMTKYVKILEEWR